MWKYYDDLPNHLRHWRYEVDGKFYITQVRHNIEVLHFFRHGNDVYNQDNPSRTKYRKADRSLIAPMENNAEARKWAEAMWLTGGIS